MSASDPEVIKNCLTFVRTWAEAVLRQIERVHAAREKLHFDSRNYERLEDWSPSEEDLAESFRSVWAEEHALVWSAHQLERWSRRLAKERRQNPPERDETLARVRNALEHLDEADFDDIYAVAGEERNNRSLRDLPDSRIMIAAGGGLSFGLIDNHELEARALAIVCTIEDELEQQAVDRYLTWRGEEEKEDRALRRVFGDPVD